MLLVGSISETFEIGLLLSYSQSFNFEILDEQLGA